MPSGNSSTLRTLLDEITLLTARLPDSVPEGTVSDKLYTVITTIEGDNHWETFNRRFDILFGEDCRDASGRLVYLHRGRLGMDVVCAYLEGIVDAKDIPIDLTCIKLERLLNELKYLTKNVPSQAAVHRGLKLKGPSKPANGNSAPKTSSATVSSEKTRNREAKKSKEPTKQKKQKLPKQSALKSYLSGPPVHDLSSDDEEDATYNPPKRRVADDQSPEQIFDSDGNEIIEDVGLVSDNDLGSKQAEASEPKKRKPKEHKQSRKRARYSDKRKRTQSKGTSGSESSSSESSDGQGALRDVEEAESNRHGGAKKGPESDTRKYWGAPVAIVDKHNVNRWQFKCKYCATTRTFLRTAKESAEADIRFEDERPQPMLGNLATHTRTKHEDIWKGKKGKEDEGKPAYGGYSKASAKLMEDFLKEGALNPAAVVTYKGFLRLFSAWILDEDLPFTTGEAPSLRNLFRYLKVKFALPTDTTVRNTLAEIFIELHGIVVRELAAVKSKIAYSTDTWTTRQMVFTFAGTIANWINEDWELVERVVDFYHIEGKEHQGEAGAAKFAQSASKRGGLNKINNASVNDVLVRTLGKIILKRYGEKGCGFHEANAHIRCIAHVVNLVVQSMLSALDEAIEPELEDYYLLNKHLHFHYNLDEDEDIQELDAEADQPDVAENSDDEADWVDEEFSGEDFILGIEVEAASKSAVKKLRLIATKITSSPQRRQKFRNIARKEYKKAEQERLRTLMIVQDVSTRWNSTHAMMRRALLLRQAIDKWTIEQPLALRPLLLTTTEWSMIEKLADMLEIFTQVTNVMSRAKTPTLPWVIPMYQAMKVHLEKHVNDESLDLRLRNAAATGLRKLDSYYSKAMDCQSNVIATVLHPSFRIKWFQSKLGPEQAAKARALFEHVYHEYEVNAPPTPADPKNHASKATKSDGTSNFLDEICMTEDDHALPTMAEKLANELYRFLDAFEGGHGDKSYPLQWYKDYGQLFPVISAMAQDFLAIPATSVSVERLFSKSRHLCTDMRTSMKARTITQAMCTKTWIQSGLLGVEPPQK